MHIVHEVYGMVIKDWLDPDEVAASWSHALRFLVQMKNLTISVQRHNPRELLVDFNTTPQQIQQYLTVLKKRDEFSGQ